LLNLKAVLLSRASNMFTCFIPCGYVPCVWREVHFERMYIACWHASS